MASHPKHVHNRGRTHIGAHRPVPLAAALATAGLLAAGCGSNSPSSPTTSPAIVTQALAFSKCMRAHRVTNFPDRGDNVTGSYTSVAGIRIPSSISVEAPAYQSANKSCEELLSAIFSPQGKPALTASKRAALITQAQCMREHGVPNYPDPTFPTGGGISIQTGPGVNAQSPAFQQAEKACHTGEADH